MNRIIFALVVGLVSTGVFAAEGKEPYGVFPRPATQPTFKVYSSGLSPFTIIYNSGARTLLFQDLEGYGLAGPSHVAYVDNHKVRIASTSEPIDPATMTESWMLFFFHSSQGWDKLGKTPYRMDVPIFVVLQRMPAAIKPAGSGIEFTFANGCGYIALMPFFGTSYIRATQTAGWKDALPQDVFLRCRLLAEVSREHPIKVEEQFKVSPSQDRVVIRNRFDFLSIDDDWKTGHRKVAPLEYTVALAQRYKFRLLSVAGQVTDLDTPVGTGAWAGIEGDECSYTLTGLLRYINTVEQPKVMPADHPLLAEARKNFEWKMPDTKRGSLVEAWSRAMILAGHLPYAEVSTQQALRVGFKRICGILADPDLSMMLASPDYPSFGDLFRGIHDMTASAGELSLVQPGWGRLREAYCREAEISGWGLSLPMRWTQRDERYNPGLTASIHFARMAWWLGDEEMYRLGSYHVSKQFLALWTASMAYPKWIKEKNLWASVADAGLDLRDDNGAIIITDPSDEAKRTIAVEDLPFSRARDGNFGFCPGNLQGFHHASDAEMRFIKDRMPDYAKFFLDTFARTRMPEFHKAVYLDQSKLPATAGSVPLKAYYEPLLQPRLDDWDFYFDTPLSQRSGRRERFWQNNGGVKGHEFEIILAGIERKYVSLWQGSAAPSPDAAFHVAGSSTGTSPVFVVAGAPGSGSTDLFWQAIQPPQRPKADSPFMLPLCGVRTR